MATVLTSLANQPVYTAQKPAHKRAKPKRKQITAITPVVAEEVHRRAAGRCERCGRSKPNDFAYKLELAHLVGRAQIGRGDQPWNVAALCGPQVNTGTCHNWLDHNRKPNRNWTAAKIKELKAQYNPADWPE